ncbi:MAG TPA: hypothetical protein V6D06_16790, partial [Trichocoleus sp.]
MGSGLVSCAKPTAPQTLLEEPTTQPNRLTGPIEEVSPPETLQTLKQIIDAYEPQVRILSPRPGEVVEDTSVSVRFQVRGLPLYKDQQWELGPHLHVFLDDEPYRAVYDLSEPLMLSDLAPGTHTLRVFASRPWHESFKNQGAFDQRTFHIYAQTPQKALDKNQPLLTYSRPQGTYGAEPIMLDFYLTNAPLHLIAQEDSQDAVTDWRIRCTINGQSFVFDQWQPIYLKGFKPGQNWVQLELIDENGDLIDNAFNNTVRVITYEPGGDDTLSKLVRGELSLQEVAGIVDPTYVPPALPEPEVEAQPTELAPSPTEPETNRADETPAEPSPLAPEPEAVQPEVSQPEPYFKEQTPEERTLKEPLLEEPPLETPALKEPIEEAPSEQQPLGEPALPVAPIPPAIEIPTTETPEPETPELEAPEPETPALELPPPTSEPEEKPADPAELPSSAPDFEQNLPSDSPSLKAAPPEQGSLEEAPLLSPPAPDAAEPSEEPSDEPSEEQPFTPIAPDGSEAPTSKRFLQNLKQWRQQYQKPKGAPNVSPELKDRETPPPSLEELREEIQEKLQENSEAP